MTAILNSTGGIYEKVRAGTDVVGYDKAKLSDLYAKRTRILIYDSMPESAQDFGASRLISAFSNAALDGFIEANICVNPTVSLSDEVKNRRKDAQYYVTEEQALEKDYDIIIANGWARTRGQDLAFEESYKSVSSFLRKNDERIPIMIGLCAGAEALAFDKFDIKSTPFAGGKKHGYFEYTKQNKNDRQSMFLSDNVIMPASRNMDISWGVQNHKDLMVQFNSSEAKVGIAKSIDERIHLILTHPEYDETSIPKEQIRDWFSYAMGDISEEPTNAYNILTDPREQKFANFKDECRRVREKGLKTKPASPLEDIKDDLHNHWHSTFIALAASYIKLSKDINSDGRAQSFAPQWKPATASGIVAPA